VNALIGYVSDVLINAIFGLELEESIKCKTIRAFTKLLWIQNDMFARHLNHKNVEAAHGTL
jgi:hypothetical protein